LFDSGTFVRTHVMRPTWHFVAAEDLRWLLSLTAARVHQASAYQYRALALDPDTRARGRDVIRRALDGGKAMTREELGHALVETGMRAEGLRMTYFVMDAELEAVICSGPRRGKRQTYALVDDRIPPSRPRERDEALAEVATRYVVGHGPAQDVDLAWWSGLTLRDARRALESAGDALRREQLDARTFWVDRGEPASDALRDQEPSVHLLPNYDELLVAFRDRSDAMDRDLPSQARIAEAILAHVIVRDGLVVGGWKRKDAGSSTAIALNPQVRLSGAELAAMREAVVRLAAFLGRPVEVAGLD